MPKPAADWQDHGGWWSYGYYNYSGVRRGNRPEDYWRPFGVVRRTPRGWAASLTGSFAHYHETTELDEATRYIEALWTLEDWE